MDDELDAISQLPDDQLVVIAQGKRPDAAECALSELFLRSHPDTAATAKKVLLDATDDWLRGSAIAILLRLRDVDAWNIVSRAIDRSGVPVLVRVVEEMATTDDPDVFRQADLIARVRERLAELPEKEQYLADLFRNRFGGS